MRNQAYEINFICICDSVYNRGVRMDITSKILKTAMFIELFVLLYALVYDWLQLTRAFRKKFKYISREIFLPKLFPVKLKWE